jgi:hypothetical protein
VRLLGLTLLASLLPVSLAAQTPTVVTKGKPTPGFIADKLYVLLDKTVTRDWPKMLPAINVPSTLQDLSPGQCLRVVAVSAGDGHETLLAGAQIGFTVQFAGHSDDLPLAAAASYKQIKPVGSDFVMDALRAGGVHYDLPTTATIAASAESWCVPADAQAGPVEIRATLITGKQRKTMDLVTLPVLTPENPPAAPFSDDKGLEAWLQTYHDHPQAALLGVAMDRAVSDELTSPLIDEFFVVALRRDAATAARLGPWLAKANHKTRVTALSLLAQARVTLLQPPTLTDNDKVLLAAAPKLPDPFTVSSDQEQFSKLDMLWVNFSVTGDRAAIDALTGMLTWKTDYEAFQTLRASHQPIPGLTPSIVRGVAYTAVGWSLGSFQRTDPLASDYIAAIAADPSTPSVVKQELAVLDTDPAFKQSAAR